MGNLNIVLMFNQGVETVQTKSLLTRKKRKRFMDIRDINDDSMNEGAKVETKVANKRVDGGEVDIAVKAQTEGVKRVIVKELDARAHVMIRNETSGIDGKREIMSKRKKRGRRTTASKSKRLRMTRGDEFDRIVVQIDAFTRERERRREGGKVIQNDEDNIRR